MDFDADTSSHDADLLDLRGGESIHFLSGDLGYPADLCHIVLFLKQLDRLECRTASQRIPHESRPVHQGFFRIITVKCVVNFMIRHGHSMTDMTSCQSFPQNQDIREHQICHEPVACAAESRRHFIEYQQHAVFITKLPRTL